MPYPQNVSARLQEVSGTTCTGQAVLLYNQNATAPKYTRVSGTLIVAYLTRYDTGGGVMSWKAVARSMESGTCGGIREFVLETVIDNPVGIYGLNVGGTADTSAAKLTVVEI